MPLTIAQSVEPRRLVAVYAKINTGDAWTAINGCARFWWRPEALVDGSEKAIDVGTAGVQYMYRQLYFCGAGRRVTGVMWTRDCEAVQALVAASNLVASNFNTQSLGRSANFPAMGVDSSVILAAVFNTGLDIDNFRYAREVFQPVICGVGFGNRDIDWLRTLQGSDGGLRGLFPLPWRLGICARGTAFLAANTNAVGMYTNFSNTANFAD